MGFRIAICDDDKNMAEKLEELVAKWGEQSGHPCQVRSFASGEEFLFEYAEDKAYDILLLDVEMEGITGIELARHVRRDSRRVEILFITSHLEFMGEGYEVDALHYLVKPVSEGKLFSVLDRAAEKLQEQPPSVVISCQGETVKLYEEEILYVEAFLHYISIHTKEREYKIKESISSFEERLSEDFYRIHRSYLVSLKHIVRISRTSVTVEGGFGGNGAAKTELPLSRGKYDAVNYAFIARN